MELARQSSPSASDSAVVVGFDRSAASRTALATAADLGARLGAELRVVHAVDLADYPVDPDAADWEVQAGRSLEAERQLVSEELASYPLGWSFVVVRAEPADALERAADELDALMIVVGVRSPGWRHLLERLGGPSVSHRLIGRGHRPVLVVTEPGDT